MIINYKEKYLKYKKKYFELKQKAGAGATVRGKCKRKTYLPCGNNDNCEAAEKNGCNGECICHNYNCECITIDELIKKKEFIKKLIENKHGLIINNNTDEELKTFYESDIIPPGKYEVNPWYDKELGDIINKVSVKSEEFDKLLKSYLKIEKIIKQKNSPDQIDNIDKIEIVVEVGGEKSVTSQLRDEDNNNFWPSLPTVHGYFVRIHNTDQEGAGAGKELSEEELEKCKEMVKQIEVKFKGNDALDIETIDEEFNKLKKNKCPVYLYKNIKEDINKRLEEKQKDEIEKQKDEIKKEIDKKIKDKDNEKNTKIKKKEDDRDEDLKKIDEKFKSRLDNIDNIDNEILSQGWVLTHVDDKHVYKLLSSPHPTYVSPITHEKDNGWVLYLDQELEKKKKTDNIPFKMKLTFENYYKEYVLKKKKEMIKKKKRRRKII